jgi:hypothetical protein
MTIVISFVAGFVTCAVLAVAGFVTCAVLAALALRSGAAAKQQSDRERISRHKDSPWRLALRKSRPL